MPNDVFTDQEDQLIEQIKAAFYYPGESVTGAVLGLLHGVDPERAGEILDAAGAQVGFEQRQRRDYILSSLGVDTKKAKASDASIFARAVAQFADNPAELQSFISQSNLDKAIFTAPPAIPTEVVEQAAVFETVAASQEEFYAESIYSHRVKPILAVLQKLPPDRLNSLLSLVKDYIQRVKQLGNDIVIKNPDYSNAMKEMFRLVGLSVSAEKQETIGDRLKFCSDVLLCAGVLAANNNQGKPLTDEQVGLAAGLWVYNLEGAPIGEEIIDS